ncbi:MAG: UDP-N-acetylglucosamine 4,6-dehydratase (inverting) [Polyangiaceae bacterium]|nr:UDP-N-acetylglucosamine 4,6-dehydratase (inverting) [Polyangiaceae bacterium]
MLNLLPPLSDRQPKLDGAVVLVTGGTGSFGRAFVRRLLAEHQPAKVIVFSRDEQKHYAMQAEIPDARLRFFVGDVRDRDRLMRALGGVDVVVHAAAMKHVPIAEYNPIEAIRTNIDGAANLIDAALERRVSRLVALSTDKAVSPVNLYGATKLCMEKLFVAANSYAGASGTRFDLVRYGNVVGSKGSVVPLFLEQARQGRLTVTEPAMTRFWIGMGRAVDLVLLALDEGTGGEVFVPKLPACTVATLAEAVAPGAQVDVVGIRPGEKVHEAMITVDEARSVLDCGQYFVIRPQFPAWGERPRTNGAAVAPSFSYSSDRAELLGVAQVRALLADLGLLPA